LPKSALSTIAWSRFSGIVSSYAGGTAETATYKQCSSGKTGHAESVRVTYDPSKVSFSQLLQVFFTAHDPTTKDRQGPDSGHPYRGAFFYADQEQARVVDAYIRQLESAKVFSSAIVTTLEPLTGFYPAEPYHQDFVRLHPDHSYVLQESVPKMRKIRERFPELLKPDAANDRALDVTKDQSLQ
jgi:peptide-methionine (S)-S-oxide reductase